MQRKKEEYTDDGDSRRTRGELFAAELALVLYHAVDVGIHRFPIASLHIGYKTGKHLTDIFLMLRANRGREFVGVADKDAGPAMNSRASTNGV